MSLELERWPPKGIDGLVMRSQPLRAEFAMVFMIVVGADGTVQPRVGATRRADGGRVSWDVFEGGAVNWGESSTKKKIEKARTKEAATRKKDLRRKQRGVYSEERTKGPPPSPSTFESMGGLGQ
jgi:hypothetical protein